MKPTYDEQGTTTATRRSRRVFALAAVVAILALGLAAIAFAAEKPVTVQAGNLRLAFNGGVKPKALSTKLEPISLNVQGKIAEVDGSQPPALTEVVIDADKNGAIDAKGVPTCTQGQLEARTTTDVEKICGPAIIGSGTTDVTVQFPEARPVELHSKLLVVNGGEKGATTTIYIHAFLTAPVTAAVVAKVTVSKERNGPYGLRSVATIPKIANYAGSVTAFNLAFKKKLFSYKGTKHGYLMARCANGKFVAQGEAKFHDGTQIGPAKIVRPCTPKG